jgi:hypothetical protein
LKKVLTQELEEKMNKELELKFRHNELIYVKKGYYKFFNGKIIDYKVEDRLDPRSEEVKKVNVYKVKLDNLNLKEDLWIVEEDLRSYKKWILF